MSRFVSIPALRIGELSGEWITAEPLLYASDLVDEVIEVPAGFVTDLASIPPRFEWLVPINGRHRLAAIVHDYLYRAKPDWCTRELADQIFLEAMVVLGEAVWRRQAMYWAVRLGGRIYWRECKKCSKRGKQ